MANVKQNALVLGMMIIPVMSLIIVLLNLHKWKLNRLSQKIPLLFAKKIIPLIILLLFSQCGKGRYNNSEVIDLLSPPESLMSDLSEIATDLKYVPLQSSDNSLIERIEDIKTHKDQIFVNTRSELMCFDFSGKYLFKLSKVGRGPGEYQFIEKFDVNFEGDIIIIKTSENILIYRIKGNEVIFNKTLSIRSKIPNQISDVNFIPGQNNLLISYEVFGEEPFRNIVINLEEDTLATRFNYYKFTNSSQLMGASRYENLNYSFNNSLFFKEWESDTIFTIGKSVKIKPHLIMDSDGKHPSPDNFKNYLNKDISEMMTSSPVAQNLIIYQIIETQRYIIYKFSYLTGQRLEVFDKVQNKKFGIVNDIFLKDDISGGLNFNPQYSSEGNIISVVDPIVLKEHLSSNTFINSEVKNPDKKRALEQLAKTLNITDNPVLIIIDPKE